MNNSNPRYWPFAAAIAPTPPLTRRYYLSSDERPKFVPLREEEGDLIFDNLDA
jgi:hypothetical protein